jgi:cell division protein FtsQ
MILRIRLGWLEKVLFISLLLSLIASFLLIMLDQNTLPITTVRIEGIVNTDPQALQKRVSSVAVGGFFEIDLTMLRLNILPLPWIKEVQIRSQWPDTLLIQVQEYTAVAWMNKSLIDNEGNKLTVNRYPLMDLPRFTGPLDKADDILKHYNQLAPLVQAAGLHIKEFGYNARKTWYMLLNNNMKLNLGRGETKTRFQRFLKIYHRLKTPSLNKIGDKAVLIDLRYTNGIAVRTAK